MPPHDHSSLPVFGSKPLTFCGTDRISSSWSPIVTTIGVLHEPSQSLFLMPSLPPGSSCRHTSLPVFLSRATRAWFVPGPTQRMQRSPCRIGEEALPQRCSILPRSFFHSSLP